MPRVACRAAYCAHNLGGEFCNAAEIEINRDTCSDSEETDCSTFIPRAFSGSLVALDNVNYTGLVAQAFSGEQLVCPEVRCMLRSCRYHEKGECKAQSIEILAQPSLTSTETRCRSYCE
ncbi:MAG: DUF1540 domain-containing protein [Bacillota bacterium]|nr:DUF1540 domain-containing protein [Bacillota bacterium]MDW7682964.1 DUF1540 domain-containing protein [Bacillota bacterium]